MKPSSLKMRAIGLLSQREHSSSELRRKLMRMASTPARAADQGQRSEPTGDPEGDERGHLGVDPMADQDSIVAEVDVLIAWLTEQGFLSEERFVESRVHARASRYGSLRIRQELAQHGLSLGAEQAALLHESEWERCKSVWQRKFGQLPASPQERAKQTRFLLARGFPSALIRQLLRDSDD